MTTDDRERVVIVDDAEDLAEALAMGLTLDGYEVKTANNGRDALQLIADFKPLCVLLDIGMPGLDGHQTAAELRSQYGSDLVMIAITGGGHADERVSPAFASFDFYIRKPFDPAALRKILPPRAGGAPA